MNAKIREHLEKICKRDGYSTDDDSLLETVTEAKELYTELGDSHRWYDEMLKVVEVEGMVLGFIDYHTTGDANASDMDLDPLQLDNVAEYEPVEVTKTIYKPVKS